MTEKCGSIGSPRHDRAAGKTDRTADAPPPLGRYDDGGISVSDVDLFGQPVAPVLKTTGWGEHIDRLARDAGGWPDDVVVYAMEVLGDVHAPKAHKYIQMTGDVPTGHHADGSLKWPRGTTAKPRTAIVSMAAYSAACAQHKATGETK